MRGFLSVAVVLLVAAPNELTSSQAETIPTQLQWSSALCEELGYGDKFDYCGNIEFCDGSADEEDDEDYCRRRRRLRLRRWKRHRELLKDERKEKMNLRGLRYYSEDEHTESHDGADHDESYDESMRFNDERYDEGYDESMIFNDEGYDESMGYYEENEMMGGEYSGFQYDSPYGPPPEANMEDFHEFDVYDESNNGFDEFGRQHSSHSDDSHCLPKARYGFRLPGQRCTHPGPLIRMARGKRYGLFLTAPSTDVPCNVHAHGLHIPGHGNGDDPLRTASRGNTIIYEYDIPSHHMGGTHWYHSHVHGRSAEQVGGGAYGMLVIEDGDVGMEGDDEAVAAFLRNERLLLATNKSGRWRANGHTKIDSYSFQKNVWYRLRVFSLNVDENQSSQNIQFSDGCVAHALAHDGIFRFRVPKAEPATEFSMGVSSRLDVAIKCSESGTIKVDHDTIAKINVNSDDDKNDTLALANPFVNDERQWSSLRPPYLADLQSITPNTTWHVKLDETNINGEHFSPKKPLCVNGHDLQYDTVTQWNIKHSATHPLHAHVYPMQVTGDCGERHDVGEYYDVLVADGVDCKVRLRLIDVGGPMLVHCHIYRHGDQGSMGFLNVIGGPRQHDEPRVHTCSLGEGKCDKPVEVNTCD